MKRFLKNLFLLICLFSSIGLSAAHIQNSAAPKRENNLIETKAIRTDQQGIDFFERNLDYTGNTNLEREWKCPYCNRWWPMGVKCQYSGCPTNQW